MSEKFKIYDKDSSGKIGTKKIFFDVEYLKTYCGVKNIGKVGICSFWNDEMTSQNIKGPWKTHLHLIFFISCGNPKCGNWAGRGGVRWVISDLGRCRI